MKIAIVCAAMAGLVLPASSALAAPAAPPGLSDGPGAVAPTNPAGQAAPAAGGAGVAGSAPAGAGAVPAVGAPAAPAGPALVAHWTFDAGAVDGRVADTSGRAPALTVRAADQGVIRFEGGPQGKFIAFPAVCAATGPCPRGLLEAANDVDLNPGTRLFRWSARIHLTKAQLQGSANVMQKGVANTSSQWKMQVGATHGRAQCVVVGAGSPAVYVARSASTVADGAWHKVLCQRSGSTLSIYVDGVQRGQTTIPASLSISNTMPLRVGGPNFTNRREMYHGLLDDVYAELG